MLTFCVVALPARAATYYVIVSGLGGEPDYEQRFTAAANDLDRIFKAGRPVGARHHAYRRPSNGGAVEEALAPVARDAKADDDFVLVLIGHGSFDGVEYKFNLVGPDMTATDIAALCDRIAARRQLIVDTTSSSGGASRA